MQLNKEQQMAVDTTEGAVLVLAGAGSGKTRVLTQRVAHLLESGKARPWEILAITFTNKAAAEMRERIADTVEFDIRDMWVSTFHAMCVRMLRRYADKIGYTSNFLIYDTLDTQRVLKNIIEEFGLKDDKAYNERYFKNLISKYKNGSRAKNFGEYADEMNPFVSDYADEIFDRYEAQMKIQNAMDFDDLLLNTLLLLETDDEAREYYQKKFRYILVDEYQDTNMVQYELVHILAQGSGNLFVVGDDDQSIYAFRGANIRNILEFEKDFQGAVVIRLEQNYRSDKRILDVANCIIRNNEGRKGKTLWSDIQSGEKPVLFTAQNEGDEASRIARDIQQMAQQGVKYSDMAVLYRMHTLARVLEERLRMYAIPYRVYGGQSFYERKEIKDIVAYLNLVANPAADIQLLRIINVPRRGIGDAKITELRNLANENGIPILEVMRNAEGLVKDKALIKKSKEFLEVYDSVCEGYEEMPVHEVIERVFEGTGYKRMLVDEGTPEAQMRIENVEELINSSYPQEGQAEQPLEEFLQNVTLITDLDSMDEQGGVTLMTMHAAKGLEFDVVYVAGMDETVFPSQRALEEDNLEEERRLCYVAVTRAKKRLFLLNTQVRSLYGRTQPSTRSRFIDEIDAALLEDVSVVKKQTELPKGEETKSLFSGGMQAKKPQPKKVSGDFHVGTVVEHGRFGQGTIKEILGEGDARVAV
ncbi:UvrD-helicase domain-containing protein, partial [Christensenellaceae bacterium OttesenSCG-928-K19]|nr:UvrD-helicase domain-containing protein [Christensenellaceae bacterium OttesenSCG-928-K19]